MHQQQVFCSSENMKANGDDRLFAKPTFPLTLSSRDALEGGLCIVEKT
jgi:hypothetical protein